MNYPAMPLGDLVSPRPGTRNPATGGEGTFTYVDLESIDRETKAISAPKVTICKDAPSRARKVIKANDVLVALVRPNLNAVAVVPPELDNEIASTGFCVLRATERVLPKYIYFAVRSPTFINGLCGLVSGALYPAVTESQVLGQRIPVPPVEEQRRIADVLSRAENIVRMRREAEQRAKDIIPALFLDMFGDPVTNPKGWEPHALDGITDLITYGFTCPMKHLSEGIPIVTAKNVIDGRIDFDDVHFADHAEFNALTAKSKPLPGDVLVTKDGTIGRCAAVDTAIPFCINQSVALIRPRPRIVLPEYIVGFLRYPTILEGLQNMGKGQALKHLQITELAKRTMPIPPMAAQREYATAITAMNSLHLRQMAAENSASNVFQSLLAGAFSEARAT
jgi:type I restriction enzyme, S subunit